MPCDQRDSLKFGSGLTLKERRSLTSEEAAAYVSLEDWPIALLAGGLATRLRPLTEKIPKALVKVANEPFLAHQLRLLHSQGIRQIIFALAISVK